MTAKQKNIENSLTKIIAYNLSFGFFSLEIQRDSGSDCDFFAENAVLAVSFLIHFPFKKTIQLLYFLFRGKST